MISVFDLEKLRGILKDFYEISHIRITVFDENRNELVSYPTAVASYCAVIRGSIKGLDACLDCDRRACETAAKSTAPTSTAVTPGMWRKQGNQRQE